MTSVLTRALNANEQRWLSQCSNIFLVARITNDLTEDALRLSVDRARAVNPFLQVSIDASSLCYKVNDPADLFTSEELLEAGAVDAAVKRQLDYGIDRDRCLARVHLLRSSQTDLSSHLVIIADHLCFDGRSLMILLNEAVSTAIVESSEVSMLDFVEWQDFIPTDMTFDGPFQSPVVSVKMPLREPKPEELASSVLDVVVTLEPEVFGQLKLRTKDKGTTLNAPLMAAFLAAMADAAMKLKQESSAPEDGYGDIVNVRSICAVDLRTRLGLPPNYMNNSAGCVPVHAVIRRGSDLWPMALKAQSVLLDNIERGEGFRLHDITKRGAYAEFGPYFDILCLWSNMGIVQETRVESVEVHVRGPGNNPIISAHPITTGRSIAITLTYSPAFHDRGVIEFAAERFLHHARALSASN